MKALCLAFAFRIVGLPLRANRQICDNTRLIKLGGRRAGFEGLWFQRVIV